MVNFMTTGLLISVASFLFSFSIWSNRGGFYKNHRAAEFVLTLICTIVFTPCLFFIIGNNIGFAGALLVAGIIIFSFHMSGRFFPSQEFSEVIISMIFMANSATFFYLTLNN